MHDKSVLSIFPKSPSEKKLIKNILILQILLCSFQNIFQEKLF